MKKLVFILSIVSLLLSCDDGDINLESFNFDSVSIQKCTSQTFLYKTNSNELLLLDISFDNFVNEVTPADTPRTVSITGTNKVYYRIYSNAIPTNFLCNTVTPATPIVTNEWTATGGTVEITTRERRNLSTDVLEGYNHTIVFKNISFSNGSNVFNFTEYTFGTFQTTI